MHVVYFLAFVGSKRKQLSAEVRLQLAPRLSKFPTRKRRMPSKYRCCLAYWEEDLRCTTAHLLPGRWAQDLMYEICGGHRECVEEVWRLCGGRYECVRAAKATFEAQNQGALPGGASAGAPVHLGFSRMLGLVHLLLECPAMQPVRDRHPASSSPSKGSVQLVMRQPDIVKVVHFVMDCFDLLGAAPDAHDDGCSDSDSSSSALAAG